ncbi:MAG: DnaJ C-terminal domain-containing protein [Thermoanaerobaculia bacterium]
MEYRDYYATLGVLQKASADEIQKAYRKLARKYHPDVNSKPGAEERFKEITEAYEVLKDPEKRKTYDRYGSQWKSFQGPGGGQPGAGFPPGFENVRFDFGGGGGGFGGGDHSSFFDMLFGSGGPFGGGGAGAGPRSRGRRSGLDMRGQDQEARIALTIEEAAEGGDRRITVSDPVSGQGKTYSVKIPPGVREGQKVRLAGRGGPGAAGSPPGDLFLKVELKPHDHFQLEGHDLHVTVPVTPWDAALGAEASIKTLNGAIKIKLPPGTSSGRKMRLRGKGFPKPRGGAGDLYAEIQLVVPAKLTPEERELFERLAKISSFKPGAEGPLIP